MTDIGFVPPQATEIEGAILGALILESESFHRVSGLLKPEMFYKHEHQVIFETIAEMHRSQKSVDLMTITRRLKDAGKIDEIGGPKQIISLTSNMVSAYNIEQHARIIADKYILRNAITKASEIQRIAYSNGDPDEISEIWGQFETETVSIFTGNETGASMVETLTEALSEIEKRQQEREAGKFPGIKTGFTALDDITGGWRKGRLIVLGGRPGHGKSSLALYFAIQAAEQGVPVFYFSLEMIKSELAEICLAGIADISRTAIRDGNLSGDDFAKLHQATGKLERHPIRWFDNPDLAINQIIGIVKSQMRKHGKGIVIIDYLQLVRPERTVKGQIREQQIAEITRSLKRLTISEKIPVILLSQLNRQGDTEEPKLAHLRESGAIEQDADIVLFVWKPVKDGLSNDDNLPGYDSLLQLKVAKNRQGRLGTMAVFENGQMTRFRESPMQSRPAATPINGKTPYNPNERIERRETEKLPF